MPSGPQFFHLCSGGEGEALLAQHALVRMTPASVDASPGRGNDFVMTVCLRKYFRTLALPLVLLLTSKRLPNRNSGDSSHVQANE